MIEASKIKKIVEMPETLEKLQKYKYIMGAVYSTEVSADYTFQKAYCDFYLMRKHYSEEFLNEFFVLMEELKEASSTEFRDAFARLMEAGDKGLMRAASLLVHTVSPRFPIWDKGVAKRFFDMDDPEGGEVLMEKCCRVYEDYQQQFYVYLNSQEGDIIVQAFDERFPSAEISDVVKLDLVIWEFMQESDK